MSITKTHYVLQGIKFNFDDFYDRVERKDPNATAIGADDDEPFWDEANGPIFHKNNICVIPDAMNGEYVYVGHVTQKSGDNGDLDDNGVTERPLNSTVLNWVYEAFGFTEPCSLHIFTHYR